MKNRDRERIIKSIKDRQFNVTIYDVAIDTGLPTWTVNLELDRIAAGHGTVEVDDKGQIRYQFSSDITSGALLSTVERRLSVIARCTWIAIRDTVSFFVIASMFTVMTTVVCICLGLSFLLSPFLVGQDKDYVTGWLDRLAELPPLHPIKKETIEKPLPLEPVQKSSVASSEELSTKPDSSAAQSDSNKPTPAPKGLIAECSSYLFGSADPNENIQQRQMELVGRLIAKKCGVVTMDELAPYTLDSPEKEEIVFQILKTFDGRPLVTESGNIIYVFPSMYSSELENGTELPPYLEERLYRFTHCKPDAMINLVLLSTLNLVGSAWLRAFFLLFNPVAEILVVINFLLITSLIYLMFPLARYVVVSVLNRRILHRNARRAAFCQCLEKPPRPVKAKLIEAEEYRHDLKEEASKKTIYSTNKDLLEQQFLDFTPPFR